MQTLGYSLTYPYASRVYGCWLMTIIVLVQCTKGAGNNLVYDKTMMTTLPTCKPIAIPIYGRILCCCCGFSSIQRCLEINTKILLKNSKLDPSIRLRRKILWSIVLGPLLFTLSVCKILSVVWENILLFFQLHCL